MLTPLEKSIILGRSRKEKKGEREEGRRQRTGTTQSREEITMEKESKSLEINPQEEHHTGQVGEREERGERGGRETENWNNRESREEITMGKERKSLEINKSFV